MKIWTIDDEALALSANKHAIEDAEPDCELAAFQTLQPAIEALQAGEKPDVIFLDIQMPGHNGIDVARQFRELCPTAKIIFVTAYSEYALKAFEVHARGYLMKPVTAMQIREQLDSLGETPEQTESRPVRVQCFGNFEVFFHGKPLYFARKKSKELLALLVDRMGASLSTREIAEILYNSEDYSRTAKNQVNVLISALRKTLREIGMEKMIIKDWNSIAVDTSTFDCDYYGFLSGDVDCINQYMGQYMQNYSWAQFTNNTLNQKTNLG